LVVGLPLVTRDHGKVSLWIVPGAFASAA
jgi:hypothetical protein